MVAPTPNVLVAIAALKKSRRPSPLSSTPAIVRPSRMCPLAPAVGMVVVLSLLTWVVPSAEIHSQRGASPAAVTHLQRTAFSRNVGNVRTQHHPLALGVSAALPMHIPKVVHAQATKAGVLPHRVQVPAKERPEALASDTVLAYQVAARMYVTPNATTWRNSWRREPNSNWLPEPFWKISRPRPRRSVQPWSVRIERS